MFVYTLTFCGLVGVQGGTVYVSRARGDLGRYSSMSQHGLLLRKFTVLIPYRTLALADIREGGG